MTNETISDLNTLAGGDETLLANRYRVMRQLGQGGMGSVWLAEDTALENRPVAIKMLPAILLANPRSYQQIKSEALVSLRLTHPNIATLRSFEENGGNPFLVIDYVDGVTLEAFIAEKGVLSEEEMLRLLRPVASALDYAHREKVVHRDVKPGNVMVRRDGVPFVLDFGIAREMRETLTRVTGKLSSGTLLYMSPEQLMGAAPTPAQDVYGFAAMAYECLSGHPPFHRGQVEFQILNAEPPPLASGTPLARRILQGLAKDPMARPSSCLAVLDEVADLAPVAGTQGESRPSALRLNTTRSTIASAPVPSARPVRLDADVYLLEDEERTVFEQVVSKFPVKVHPDLDADLQHALRAHRAAGNALRRGDAEAARKLFLEVTDYPARRRERARVLVLEAFGANRLAEAFALSAEADGEDPEIRLVRGFCRQSGEGTTPDSAAARADYRVAAEAGLAEAQYNLATMLLKGEGGDVDVAGAVTWYTAAVDQKVVEACRVLGALYDEGQLVPRDAARAFDLFLRAYKLGDNALAATLGSFCAAGEDHGLNASLRHQFIVTAAAAGDEGAKRLLEEEAQRSAAEEEAERIRREEQARVAAERRTVRRQVVRTWVRRCLLGVGFAGALSLLVWGGVRAYTDYREDRRIEAEKARVAEQKRQADEQARVEAQRKVEEAVRLAAEAKAREEAARAEAERKAREEKAREEERLAAAEKVREAALLKLGLAQAKLVELRRVALADLDACGTPSDCEGLEDLLSQIANVRVRFNAAVATNDLDLIDSDVELIEKDCRLVEQTVVGLASETNKIAELRHELMVQIENRTREREERRSFYADWQSAQEDMTGHDWTWDADYWSERLNAQTSSVDRLPAHGFVARRDVWRRSREMVREIQKEAMGPAGYRLVARIHGKPTTNITFRIKDESFHREYGILEFKNLRSDVGIVCVGGSAVCQRNGSFFMGSFPQVDVDWKNGFRTRCVELVEQNGVQLWKDGPYWAECNVGASKPEEFGYYFWWGDTVGYQRVGDGWNAVDGSRGGFAFADANCPTHGKNTDELRSAGFIDEKGNLSAAHDAATAHLGAPWRMPTQAEFEALVANCSTECTILNGVPGRLITGKGDYATKSIFLPATGFGRGSGLYYPGSDGYYWSSTPNSDQSYNAWFLGFLSASFGRNYGNRCYGFSIRPLRGFVLAPRKTVVRPLELQVK